MNCKRKKCDKCGLKRKRLVAVSDICEHILCVVCYSSMVINSDDLIEEFEATLKSTFSESVKTFFRKLRTH